MEEHTTIAVDLSKKVPDPLSTLPSVLNSQIGFVAGPSRSNSAAVTTAPRLLWPTSSLESPGPFGLETPSSVQPLPKPARRKEPDLPPNAKDSNR